MIKAIIFDCFGVLVREGLLPFCERYFGDDEERMNEARSINRRLNTGYLDFDGYISELAALAGVEVEQARAEIATNPPNTELFAWIRNDLKPAYKIGLLSNAGANWLDDLFTSTNVALFDATVLSYEIKIMKPDPLAYEAIANKLGVDVSECLFIDDQPYYCEAAEVVGMLAIHYQDNVQLRESLKKYNIFLRKP